MGGLGSHPDEPVDTAEVHQLVKNETSWKNLPSMPEPMRLFSTVVFENFIFIFGGYSIKKKETFKTSFYLDLSYGINKWMQVGTREFIFFSKFDSGRFVY